MPRLVCHERINILGVVPAEAGTQYSAALRSNNVTHGILDARIRGHDGGDCVEGIDLSYATRNVSNNVSSGSTPSPGPCGTASMPSLGSYQSPNGLSVRSQ